MNTRERRSQLKPKAKKDIHRGIGQKQRGRSETQSAIERVREINGDEWGGGLGAPGGQGYQP